MDNMDDMDRMDGSGVHPSRRRGIPRAGLRRDKSAFVPRAGLRRDKHETDPPSWDFGEGDGGNYFLTGYPGLRPIGLALSLGIAPPLGALEIGPRHPVPRARDGTGLRSFMR
jgi:hypothetical protein